MPGAVFLELAAYACATTFSPGPNNILLLSCTSKFGFKKCLPLIFGIWTGLLSEISTPCGDRGGAFFAGDFCGENRTGQP